MGRKYLCIYNWDISIFLFFGSSSYSLSDFLFYQLKNIALFQFKKNYFIQENYSVDSNDVILIQLVFFLVYYKYQGNIL